MNCYKVVILLIICVSLWPRDVQSVITLVGASIRKKGPVSKTKTDPPVNVIPALVKDKKLKLNHKIVKDLVDLFQSTQNGKLDVSKSK